MTAASFAAGTGGMNSRRRWVARGYFRSLLRRRLPIIDWLPAYNSEKMLSDAIAGVTVGLTVMPQGLAYATLAGLEPQVSTTIDYHLYEFLSS